VAFAKSAALEPFRVFAHFRGNGDVAEVHFGFGCVYGRQGNIQVGSAFPGDVLVLAGLSAAGVA
jgi:uncharacterized protein YcbX